jgi:diadenosine tetraphosphate (Ap4A) HIT family hydrolase
VSGCHTCELIERRDAGIAPPWDAIVRTPHWDVVHALDTSIEGWMVLVARRHISAVADLSDAEAAELGPLVRDVSRALASVVGCSKTYVAQFAEHPLHPHVHVHVIPRSADLAEPLIGPHIFDAVGLPENERVTAATMNNIAAEIANKLAR